MNSADDDMMAGLRWELEGKVTEGFIHVKSRIEKIEGNTIVVRVLSSSLYPTNFELVIRLGFVAGEQWRVGNELDFTCRASEISKFVGER